MVKRRCFFPVLLRMTGFTGSTQCAFVCIVFLVTGVTGRGRLLFGHRPFVAAVAFRGFVLA